MPYSLKHPLSDRVFDRLRSLGYQVGARIEQVAGSGESRFVLYAADSRTGEHHIVRSDGSGSDDEIRCVNELAELVASELEG